MRPLLWLVVLAALAALTCKKDDSPGSTERGSNAPATSAPGREPTCTDVGEAFATYLALRPREGMWDDIRADTIELCKHNQMTPEEKRCWVAIQDAASHQKCLDLRKERGLPPLETPPDPDDELAEDEDAAPADDARPTAAP